MRQFLASVLSINAILLNKIQAIRTYDEALALHKSGEYREALPLMQAAADRGSAEAMSILGSMYLLGQGVKENGVVAVQWLQRAIDNGFAGAVSVLGMAYATGKAGVKIDLPKAIEMLTCAAAQGDQQSARMLEMIGNGEGMFAKRRKQRRA